jgi:UDPglucose 6-dehydrogenase
MALIHVIGLGYVGLTTALAFARMGHSVEGLDTSAQRIRELRARLVPFREPGMSEALDIALDSGRILFAQDAMDLESKPDFTFICVPTPSLRDGSSNLEIFYSALEGAVKQSAPGSIIVIKSTVPIGTASKVSVGLRPKGILVANNPEFLREGTALNDFQFPDRIIVGAEDEETSNRVIELFESIDSPKVKVSLPAAELIKYAANSYLALRLSFINEIAQLSEVAGVSFGEVSYGLSLDRRVGSQYLNPGPGWGGSCLPKDTKALVATSKELGLNLSTVSAAISANHSTKTYVVDKAVEALGGSLSGKKVTVWGLSYKSNTGDCRESPALEIIEKLISLGAIVTAYDPMVRSIENPNVRLSQDILDACDDANLLLVLTEWGHFRDVNPPDVIARMASKHVLDARRILDKNSWLGKVDFFWSLGEAT